MAVIDDKSLLRLINLLIYYQTTKVTLLAKELLIKPDLIYYSWVQNSIPQKGIFDSGNWSYFFHGLELDLTCNSDPFYIPVVFGPQGRLDTFTLGSVEQFIRENLFNSIPLNQSVNINLYEDLLSKFKTFSGVTYKELEIVFQSLESKNLVAYADINLVNLANLYRITNPNGSTTVVFPPHTSVQLKWDLWVRLRWIITGLGYKDLSQDC